VFGQGAPQACRAARLRCITSLVADNSISDADFVNSFLKAARERKLSVVAIYGVREGMNAKLRLVSSVGPGPTQGVLAWLRSQPSLEAEQAPAEPELKQ